MFRSSKPVEPQPPKPPDAVDGICASLVERWWEWNPTTSNNERPGFTHASGVTVFYDGRGAWIGHKDSLCVPVDKPAVVRLRAAIDENLEARVRGRGIVDETAAAMARAVLAGDMVAARQLADYIRE